MASNTWSVRALHREVRWKRAAKRKRGDSHKARFRERQRGGTVLTSTPTFAMSVGALLAAVVTGFISTLPRIEAAGVLWAPAGDSTVLPKFENQKKTDDAGDAAPALALGWPSQSR